MCPLVISSYLIRNRGEGPRRFLEPTLAIEPQAKLLVERTFENDEVFEATPNRANLIRRLSGAFKLLFQHHHLLRSSSTICCLDGLHFNLLLLLARAGLLATRGKTIRRHAFRDRALERLAPLLNKAPAAFGIDYITHEQVTRGSARAGADRVHRLPWKIDCDWYQPASTGPTTDGTLFIPGNAHRHDELVFPLLAAGHQVTRAGRPGRLTAVFDPLPADPRFTLLINRPHPEYLQALQSARAVVLPITTCDEPAGLTAAMEAIACGIPLISNRSMGVAELLNECRYPIPLVENLEPAAWLEAIQQIDQLQAQPSFQAALAHSREKLVVERRMKPGAGDWLERFHQLQPRPSGFD
jgi:hypothetical protein